MFTLLQPLDIIQQCSHFPPAGPLQPTLYPRSSICVRGLYGPPMRGDHYAMHAYPWSWTAHPSNGVTTWGYGMVRDLAWFLTDKKCASPPI